ncbi:MAG: hypothetical protein M1833_002759 [Piccolia ochrophora]|nr:MAG: hypothetical protein M1833_002759 [Piccolia ochrophora]
MQKLRDQGYAVDPFNTGLFPQVVHAQTPVSQNLGNDGAPGSGRGDVFIFPSGTVVAWSVPEDTTFRLVTETLLAAATNAHVSQLETEDMEYLEDPKKENSTIRGDTIVVGTRRSGSGKDEGASTSEPSRNIAPAGADNADRNHTPPLGDVDTVFAKIAFSSGLARSTKLAVLESLLNDYFESTRSIPTMLSQGSRLPYTRSFILRKTGQLLSVRAQLNLYSELTDSLPDLFWDSRHDLGLEGYYDQVGRALDVGVRIKTLNEKMDYAQEIASVLRERLSEKHGLTLEWMIIALITIEVAFEILRLYKERRENSVETETSS